MLVTDGNRWKPFMVRCEIIALLEKALAGSTIRSSDEAREEAKKETQVSVELDEEGVVIKLIPLVVSKHLHLN